MLKQVCEAMYVSQAHINNRNEWERHFATTQERQRPEDKVGMDHWRAVNRQNLAMGSQCLMTFAPANDPVCREIAPCS